MSDKNDSIVRGAAVISGLTLLSRLLGLVRDCVCAAVFGAGATWDAFSFAFRVPNLARRLLGEGALSAAFVPIFSARLEARGPQEAARLAGRVTGTATVLLAGLVLAGEAVLLALLRWRGLGAQWRPALELTAVLLPYMLPICLTALMGAVLNSLGHFAMPALAPAALNAIWILAAGIIAPRVSPEPTVRIYVVAAAVLVGGLVQLGLQLGALSARKFSVRPSLAPAHADVRRVGAAMLPVALGMAALQLNVLLDSVIAIGLAAPPGREAFTLWGSAVAYPMQAGANSVLYYANRLMQLPLGVFGIAIATAAFPALSRHAGRRDWGAFSAAVMRGLGLVAFVGIPSGVGLMLLRRPVIELVFERGAFTPAMSARTAAVTLAYATAIWAYCALHVLARAFYGLGRQRTPAAVAGIMVAANAALNLTLVWYLREAGLAAATAICATLQVVVLWHLLGKAVELRGAGRLASTVAKTLCATVCMAAACRGVLAVLPGAHGALGVKLLRAALPAAAGAAAYAAAAAALRIEEFRVLWAVLARRDGGTAGGPPTMK